MIWNVFGLTEKPLPLINFNHRPPAEGGFLPYPSFRKTQVFRKVQEQKMTSLMKYLLNTHLLI